MNDHVTKITAQTVLDLASALVSERGEGWVYPGTDPSRPVGTSCHYRWDDWDVKKGTVTADKVGQPACIVGGIFDKLGILDEVIPAGDDDSAGSFWRNDSSIRDVLDNEDDLDVEPLARNLLHELQTSQDAGLPWGVALSRAQAEYLGIVFAGGDES